MLQKRDRLRKSALREKPGWGENGQQAQRRYQAMPGEVQRLKLLAGPHPAMFSHKRNLYGMQEVRVSILKLHAFSCTRSSIRVTIK